MWAVRFFDHNVEVSEFYFYDYVAAKAFFEHNLAVMFTNEHWNMVMQYA